ncbi:MAG TPA: hypothetical protein PLV50_15215, partial [Smithella sp.]|nr:hypothetical protein [Smithella sp.]
VPTGLVLAEDFLNIEMLLHTLQIGDQCKSSAHTFILKLLAVIPAQAGIQSVKIIPDFPADRPFKFERH